jgi:hypothetical protein
MKRVIQYDKKDGRYFLSPEDKAILEEYKIQS